MLHKLRLKGPASLPHQPQIWNRCHLARLSVPWGGASARRTHVQTEQLNWLGWWRFRLKNLAGNPPRSFTVLLKTTYNRTPLAALTESLHSYAKLIRWIINTRARWLQWFIWRKLFVKRMPNNSAEQWTSQRRRGKKKTLMNAGHLTKWEAENNCEMSELL